MQNAVITRGDITRASQDVKRKRLAAVYKVSRSLEDWAAYVAYCEANYWHGKPPGDDPLTSELVDVLSVPA